MTQDDQGSEPLKKHGDATMAVSPDTQYADPTKAVDGEPPEPADTEDAEYAAGTADTPSADLDQEGESAEPEEPDDGPSAQGTDANTVSDGPDKDSGFYG